MSDAYNIRPTPAPLPLPNAPVTVPGKTMSIIALVLPFLCCWPVGMVLAIVSFVQGKGHPRGLAVAALIVNGFLALLSVVGLALAPDANTYDPAIVAPAHQTVTKANAHSIADALEQEVDADR